jgi:hypothetical protein
MLLPLLSWSPKLAATSWSRNHTAPAAFYASTGGPVFLGGGANSEAAINVRRFWFSQIGWKVFPAPPDTPPSVFKAPVSPAGLFYFTPTKTARRADYL